MGKGIIGIGKKIYIYIYICIYRISVDEEDRRIGVVSFYFLFLFSLFCSRGTRESLERRVCADVELCDWFH